MSEQMIDLSGVDLDDTFEPTVATDGSEEELRVVSLLKSKDKNGNDYMMPFFEVIDDDYCKEFGDYMPLPNEEMSPKEKNKAKLRIRDFGAAFDALRFVPSVAIKISEFINLSILATVTQVHLVSLWLPNLKRDYSLTGFQQHNGALFCLISPVQQVLTTH